LPPAALTCFHKLKDKNVALITLICSCKEVVTLNYVGCCYATVIYLKLLSETNILLDCICSFMTLMSFKV
jgi:hypothetical protein